MNTPSTYTKMSLDKTLVFIGSEGGSLFEKFLEKDLFNEYVKAAVSYKNCGFSKIAKEWNITCSILSKSSISSYLIKEFGNNKNVIIINFSKLIFSSSFSNLFLNRAFNCHPSLLPSFKGLTAINDNLNSNSLFIGCSIHRIENDVDGGQCIIQSCSPFNPKQTFKYNRNIIFNLQLNILLQFVKWTISDRLKLKNNRCYISNSSFELSNYSPNLDDDFIAHLS